MTTSKAVLIRGARIFDPGRGVDLVGDLLLSEGKVAALGEVPAALAEGAQVVDARGLLATPGLIDLHTHLREPGYEYKEDVSSGAAAAVAGGFSAICCVPNTEPPNDSRAVTKLVMERAREAGRARVFPVAAATKGRKGKELTEMGELKEAGAVAVSDDGDPISEAGMMRRVLEYASTFGLPVANHCEDLSLSRRAPVHEGVVSAWTGLRGQPASAEVVMLARDLALCAETGARYHACHLSSARSVELVREAKSRGLPVSAEVTVHHIALSHEANRDFDPNTKCNPPLRAEEDRKACLAGLRDGTIDALVTDHAPHTDNDKAVEFDDAPFGVIGLETALPVGLGLVAAGELSLETLIESLTAGPAACFGLPGGSLAPGAPADVTLVDLGMSFTIQPSNFLSKSRNTPFAGLAARGRAVATFVGGRSVFGWPEGLVR
ncbi:MAG: dihydroorotase [Polyangia bacterium]|jgi:dihydroorotase|nr:dihydroorotase [Polyangia bacterium]